MEDEWLLTPRGYRIKEKNLSKHGRLECPVCYLAVIEDEYLHCPECEKAMCLYCWESGHECSNPTPVVADASHG